MKRILGHVVSVLAIGFVASASAPACATNDQSIYVRAVLAPSTNRQQGCVWSDDPTQPALFEGTLDVGIRDNYVAVVLVGNQMVQRGDPNQTRAESNRVHLNGAVVRVTEPNGDLIGEFTSFASGFADPQSNNVPDFGVGLFTLIDAPTKDKIAATIPAAFQTKLVLANVKVYGVTVGGVDVESGEFQFPVRVCNRCLIVYADDPANPGVDCLLPLEDTGGGGTTLPCFAGQDELTPCQLCSQQRDACKGL